MEQWDKSAADYGKALQIWPENPEIWFIQACLLLQNGDTEGYKNLCSRMTKRFDQNKNDNEIELKKDNEIELLANALVLGRDEARDWGGVQKLVEQRMVKASSLPRRIW